MREGLQPIKEKEKSRGKQFFLKKMFDSFFSPLWRKKDGRDREGMAEWRLNKYAGVKLRTYC